MTAHDPLSLYLDIFALQQQWHLHSSCFRIHHPNWIYLRQPRTKKIHRNVMSSVEVSSGLAEQAMFIQGVLAIVKIFKFNNGFTAVLLSKMKRNLSHAL